jgi:hypothetical protein
MGAWDATTFGNDGAADWAGNLAEGDSTEPVADILDQVAGLAADDYLDAGDGTVALVAAEVVAAASGRPPARNAYNEDVLDWVVRHPELGTADLRALARKAVERVRTAESELLELWEDAGAAEWQREVDELLSRL